MTPNSNTDVWLCNKEYKEVNNKCVEKTSSITVITPTKIVEAPPIVNRQITSSGAATSSTSLSEEPLEIEKERLTIEKERLAMDKQKLSGWEEDISFL